MAKTLPSLQAEIDSLKQIASENMPEDLELDRFFEITIDDETAVARRITLVKQRITVAQTRIADLEAQTSTSALARAATATVAPSATSIADATKEFELTRARLERHKLELQVLQLPLVKRQALARAAEKKVAIREQQAAARRAREEAENAAREAEEARRVALEEARVAVSQAEKSLARERARIESVRAELATIRATFAASRERDADEGAETLERERSLSQRVLDPALTPDDANDLYDELVKVLAGSRGRFREALSLTTADSTVPEVQSELDLQDPIFSELPKKKADLSTALQELTQNSEALREEESLARWARAQDLAKDMEFLNQLRLQLLERLTRPKRSSVMGFGTEGLAQLRREVVQLTLAARWYLASSLRTVKNLDRYFSDFATIGRAVWGLLRLAILIGAFLFAARRYRDVMERLRPVITSRIRSRQLGAVTDRWLRFAQENGFELGGLIFSYLVFGTEASGAEVALPRSMVIGYFWYRTLMALAHHVIAEAARSRQQGLNHALSTKILGTLKVIARYTYGIYVLLVVSEQVLGRGYLYNLVVKFFWVGTLPIAFILIQRWRDDIASTYLKMYPDGRFASAVERTRTQAVGFFVALAAFGSVAARGLTLYAGDVLLRFDQTRRALAFVFRRRLEKHAGKTGRGTADVEPLPQAVKDAFTEEPVGPELLVDHFPNLDDTCKRIERWFEGDEVLSVALIGERGSGKSTWLQELERRMRKQAAWLHLESRLLTVEAISRELSTAILGEEELDIEVLEKMLTDGPKRVVIIEHGQDLLLRCVGGTQAYESFMQLVSHVGHKVLFVVSFSRYAWEFLDQRYRGRNLFTVEHKLTGWPEPAVAKLVRTRMAKAGVEANFKDLLLDPVEGDALTEELARTSDRFVRLIWDYADGNPRIALHFWVRSLVPEDDSHVRVRLFSAPSTLVLDQLEEESRFMLACIAVHENLTLDDAQRALAYTHEACRIALSHLKGEGLIASTNGTYRVTSRYYRSVIEHLKRKNLIHS